MIEEMKKLKNFILNSKDLNEPVNYFFDLTDQNKIQEAKGHRAITDMNQHAELSAAITLAKDKSQHFLNKSLKTDAYFFFEMPDHYFYHGVCTFKNAPSALTMLYFSDIETGIYLFTVLNKTQMFRFVLAKKTDSLNKH